MTTYKKYIKTAITLIAVLYLGIIFSGCCTSRNMEELGLEIKKVQVQNDQLVSKLNMVDTLAASNLENNRKTRADMSVTIDQLQDQINNLQESYADLIQKVDAIYRAVTERKVLYGSPGTQQNPNTPSGQTPVDAASTSDADCAAIYDDAFILVRQGEYEKAISSFKSFLVDCEKHELVENAHYWIGQSYYSMEKYTEAIEEFNFLLENYKGSVNTSRAMFKLGRSQQELSKKAEAKKIYQQLIDEYPGTFDAEQAKELLKDLK